MRSHYDFILLCTLMLVTFIAYKRNKVKWEFKGCLPRVMFLKILGKCSIKLRMYLFYQKN